MLAALKTPSPKVLFPEDHANAKGAHFSTRQKAHG